VKDGIAKRIEVASNVAIMLFLLVSGAVLIRQSMRPAEGPVTAPPAVDVGSGTAPRGLLTPSAGARIDVPGVTWASRKKNVVLVLSSTCHFCQEGAAFYRRVVEEARRSHVAVHAVMPQGEQEATAFLSKLGVSVDKVVSASPSGIGVRGTPTVLLVDGAGTVTGAWPGKLPPERERELLARVAGTSQ
jgi:thiol-disulfide isomerase/thioredoxin